MISTFATLSPRRWGLMLLFCIGATLARGFDDPPRPVKPLPEPKQIAWQEDGLGMFIFLGMNTFTGSEAGSGDEDIKQFNPAALDCKQWVRMAQAAGCRYIILTAKNTDGFCLWPTATTERSVKNAPWKGGKGDVVRELADACKAAGLKFGLACQPADYSQSSFKSNKTEYYKLYREQLKELLTNYGPIHEIWFDGKEVEEKSFTEWPGIINTVRQLQPDMIIKQGPARKAMRTHEDVQWVGNTAAIAPTECWAVYPRPNSPSTATPPDVAGPFWLPLEGRLALGANFWSNDNLKTTAKLLDTYYKSVGRNANLLLCVAVDSSGLITKDACTRLEQFGKGIQETFAKDLAAGKPVTASNVRLGSSVFMPENAVDNNAETYWSTDDGVTNASLEVRLLGAKEFNVVRLEENVALGQRVQEYTLEAYTPETSQWVQVAQGTTIGFRKLDRFPTVKASKIRLTITRALASPTIRALGVHLDSASDPADFEPANALAAPPPPPGPSPKKDSSGAKEPNKGSNKGSSKEPKAAKADE